MIYLYAGLGLAMMIPILGSLQFLINVSEQQAWQENQSSNSYYDLELEKNIAEFLEIHAYASGSCYRRKNSQEKCPAEP
jgi:hypothetical protein